MKHTVAIGYWYVLVMLLSVFDVSFDSRLFVRSLQQPQLINAVDYIILFWEVNNYFAIILQCGTLQCGTYLETLAIVGHGIANGYGGLALMGHR